MQRPWKLYLLSLSLVLGVTPMALAEEHQSVTFTTIGFPGAIVTQCTDINSQGDIVGQYDDAVGFHGYLLREGAFTSIDFPGAINTAAFGINPGGDIVGAYVTADGQNHGFLLSEGAFTSIDFSTTFTRVFGINARGDIVGVYDDAGRARHGFVLSEGEFTSIEIPGATLTNAWKINSARKIVGHYVSADGHSHAYLLRHGSFTSIDVPGAIETSVSRLNYVGINPRGDIIGNFCDAEPCPIVDTDNYANVHGFLLTEQGRDEDEDGQFNAFDFPGALGTASAAGINARGDIVGSYVLADEPPGTFHGYLRSRRGRDEDEHAGAR